MKDEEMAEEYAKAHIVQYPKRVIVSENGFCTSEDEVKQAFLAGLKAGRPQWHYLTEYPNDLPKGNSPVLVIIDYLALGKEYAIRENLKEDSKGVIAWCEIPEFK